MMKLYVVPLSILSLFCCSLISCKKEPNCPLAFRYTIVDSTTLARLIGYHQGARYDPELFEFQMNVKAEKSISYQFGEDSGAVFTIELSNVLSKNIISHSYVLYDGYI